MASKRWPSRSARLAISSASRRLIAAIELAIPQLIAFDLRPPAPRPGGGRLRGLPLQRLETLECLEILRGLGDEGGLLVPLAFHIAAPRCHPGRKAVDFRRSRQPGRQVLEGVSRLGEPIRPHRPP